ncbi:DEAD/DEAH box helicase [Amycolatopsis dendrobii]|uniref:DEAD/DEAH box helicase family protein n=1 Tax=Amycolatopsis dendrobii TaxID=2760662 RepID=A0A7W3W3L4_9PSEU|nr:DEAD/DEAH box helicase family protein [Amycolatopsis dendrobii]MBB1158133.1 DEAD/DEAH box helicase family protein [Amycolatopsis dendrobii]
MHVSTSRVWAAPLVVEGNTVRQLLVEAGELEVTDQDGPHVRSRFGVWPATRDGEGPADGPLTAILPTVRGTGGRVSWTGTRELSDPSAVRSSHTGAIGFRAPDEPHSLRRPQIGALHSVIGHWSSGVTDPGIVVMPTGTGKTETMLALFVTVRPHRLLVVVPTSALRDQVAAKFETLGILQREQIVSADAVRPCVAKLEHGLTDPGNAAQLLNAINVVVATPQSVGACSEEARGVFLGGFSHLMVDEAHHAPAPSWTTIIDSFSDRRVLLFTATPFREDRKSLPGRVIFRFPLREAQRDGYFTTIDYQTVASLDDTDEALADLALARLRSDLAADYDHVLMARARSVTRAKAIQSLYASKAPELSPVLLYDNLPAPKRKAVLQAIHSRESRVIVCVDMLGEGFDLPALKVAALHDAKKSLSPMIQFIGRFTRSTSTSRIGTASAFVAKDHSTALSPLRDLLREDADWNLLLHDITERVTRAAEETSTFDASFSGGPDEVTTPSLEPKMSAIAHRAPIPAWDPAAAVDYYGSHTVLDANVAIGADETVAWLVLEHRSEVSWGEVQNLEERSYELILMYFDQSKRILYIHSSENNGDYVELAEAVLGQGTTLINGPSTFRVLARLNRLIPTNIGLLDSRDHFTRFSMFVGSDVLEALDQRHKQGKSQTHIATSGFDQGEKVTISAALSGRFWSVTTAPDLRAWKQWCDVQGEKLTDDSIDLEAIFDGFVIPEDVRERPAHPLLAAEWQWQFYAGARSTLTIDFDDKSYQVVDVEFAVDDHSSTGPLRLSLVTPAWRIPYEADFDEHGLVYSPVGADGLVSNRRTTVPLRLWLNKNKPNLLFAGDRMLTHDDRLHAPWHDLSPYPKDQLVTLGWENVDVKVESQGIGRNPRSIQAYMSALLRASDAFDFLLDDDRAYEAADLVGLRADDTDLHITLVHCKFSKEKTAGARLDDLYEVCGQAVRSAKWRQHGALPLLRHLERRAKNYHARTGSSPFEIGDIAALHRITDIAEQLRPRFRILIAQPGFSKADADVDHLSLIAGADHYIRTMTAGTFEFCCHE